MNNTIARRVMILAHAICRAAATRWNCRTAEILFGECLRQAWAEIKAADKPRITTNEKGFVVFQHRSWNYAGDRNTWARLDHNRLTVNVGKGIISSGYMEEMKAFLAPYGLRITTGRMTVAL